MKYFIKGIKEGMKAFGEQINRLVNTILLTIVYLIGVGPVAIVAKITGKKFFETRTNKEKESYWVDLGLSKKKQEEYFRQF